MLDVFTSLYKHQRMCGAHSIAHPILVFAHTSKVNGNKLTQEQVRAEIVR